jgi:hypothetical protein
VRSFGRLLVCIALSFAVFRAFGWFGNPTAVDGALVLVLVLLAAGLLMSSGGEKNGEAQ